MVVILVGVVMGGDDNSGDIVDVGDGPAAGGDAGGGGSGVVNGGRQWRYC